MADQNQQLAPVSKNPLKAMEQSLTTVKSAKDLMKLEVVSNRYIANYQAATGRPDGKERFEREAFAFMEVINKTPDLIDCDKLSMFAGFIKAGMTGLSFGSGKLSVYSRSAKDGKDDQGKDKWKKIMVVEPDAHGKKEMLERMPEIKKVDEAVVVFMDDKFVIDALNKKVVTHEQSFPVPVPSAATIKAAYCTIHFQDGHREEIIMSISEILIAKSKSKMTDGGMLWKDHFAEACKKTTYNRAFKVNYKQPETAMIFKQFEVKDEETTEDVQHKPVVEELPAAKVEASEQPDYTGSEEPIQTLEAEVVNPDPDKKERKTAKLPKPDKAAFD